MSIWFYIALLCLFAAGFLLFAATDLNKRAKIITSLVALVLLPLGSIIVYFMIGQPNLQSQPLSSRKAEVTVQNMILRAEEMVLKNPDDLRGHEVLAPIYTRFERFDDLVKTRRSLLRLKGEKPDTMADLGEALVLANNGKVTFEALNLFQRILRLAPANISAGYYIAISKEQAGNIADALADLKLLLTKSNNDPEKAFLSQEIKRLMESK